MDKSPHEDGGERDACFGREGYYNNNINNRISATTHIRIYISGSQLISESGFVFG